MQKVSERYKGIFHFLLGIFFLFLAMQISEGNASSDPVGDTSSNNLSIPFFLIGITIPAVLFFFSKEKSAINEDQKSTTPSQDYKLLVEKARNAWNLIRTNNRIYMGLLIVSYGTNKFGQILDHPLFGHPLVITFVYILAFLTCIQQITKGKKLENQIKTYSIQGINIEEKAQKNGYFHKITQAPEGFDIFTLIFFRILIPICLVYYAIDFTLIAFRDIPSWVAMTGLISIPSLTAIFLWYFSCRSSFILSRKMQ